MVGRGVGWGGGCFCGPKLGQALAPAKTHELQQQHGSMILKGRSRSFVALSDMLPVDQLLLCVFVGVSGSTVGDAEINNNPCVLYQTHQLPRHVEISMELQ